MSRAAVEHYLAEYRHHPAAAPWLQARREAALAVLQQDGFPSLKHEHWKYTNIRPITRERFISSAKSNGAKGIDREQIAPFRLQELHCHELVFVNGHFCAELSKLQALPAGVVVDSLAAVLQKGNEALPARLTRLANSNKHAFAALNTAFIADGAFIHIPDHTTIKAPISLLFVAGKQSEPLIMQPRNLIVLGHQAQASVVESYVGLTQSQYLTNTVSEVSTAAGAQLAHYKLQQESRAAFHIGYCSIRQGRDSRVESHAISLGGAIARNDLDVDLAAAGAEVALNGLYLAGGRQHIDNHTLVHHRSPHTRSDEHYRGVLDEQARGVFNGKVIVHEQAQKTDAGQTNANLLLSDAAEIDTKPELEIYADDVQCRHAATVGQLDENMLFYLRARAIEAATARSLLTFAFADEVIRRLALAPLRRRLENSIVGRLPDADLIREFMP